jgi:chromosome segregation ATPase
MSNDPASIIQISGKSTLGDRIRGIASQLREESKVQIKATSRILGAAAQIAQNHDQLIDEVVDMVEEDLDQQEQTQHSEPYTVEKLQQQFKTLKDAKAHFGVKASSWAALASKLNKQSASTGLPTPRHQDQDPVIRRLEVIEHEVQALRGEINQVLSLLNRVAEKLL